MKFKLVKTFAKEFSVTVVSDDLNPETEAILSLKSLKVKSGTPSNQQVHGFVIDFQVEATLNSGEDLLIKCDYRAFFESDEMLNQEFLKSDFVSINAPAIAYPYLRSFITNILVNAGYPAIYLPVINFVELAKKS